MSGPFSVHFTLCSPGLILSTGSQVTLPFLLPLKCFSRHFACIYFSVSLTIYDIVILSVLVGEDIECAQLVHSNKTMCTSTASPVGMPL